MKRCILCGDLTNGSVGTTGIKWSCICQKCTWVAQELRLFIDNKKETFMTKKEREKLIQELLEADFKNCSEDRGLLVYILREGHKGYDHMTDKELKELLSSHLTSS